MNTHEQEERDAAIEVVAMRNPKFLKAAAKAVRECARINFEFSVDDVWPYMPSGVPVTDNRAMGAAMVEAHRAGIIEPTDRHEPSIRKGCHGHPRRIWRRV